MLLPEDHKTLKFRDKHAIISKVLIIISVTIFLVAVVMVTVAVQASLRRQVEMTKLIGLAEAQGGDITVARQIYDAIQRVSKLAKLPENEIPIYATIADVAKLQAQPIFKDAMNGDQILYYAKSQWVYVYRQQSNKLVAQGPFALPSPTPEAQPMPESQNKVMPEPQTPQTDPPETQQESPTAPSTMPSAPVSASPEADMTNP
jgi:hypothetical protein